MVPRSGSARRFLALTQDSTYPLQNRLSRICTGIPLSANTQAFLKEQVFAHICTLMPDGSPQSTIVWVDTDGEHLLVDSSINRVKTKNMQRDSRVSLSIAAPENAYRSVYVRGRVTSIAEDNDLQFIDSLANKYRG